MSDKKQPPAALAAQFGLTKAAYTRKGTADIISCGLTKVDELIADGTLQSIKLGNSNPLAVPVARFSPLDPAVQNTAPPVSLPLPRYMASFVPTVDFMLGRPGTVTKCGRPRASNDLTSA
jgi:hypothetical protein